MLVLRGIEQRLGVAERLAGCVEDSRAQAQVIHGLADMIQFRMLMIASDYEDGNDATAMRSDPAFKLAQDVLPSGPDLASQPTLSRLENLPDLRALLRMGTAMIDLYCESYARVPKRIVLDFDDTFDAVHGGQQLRLFNAHYDEYGFQRSSCSTATDVSDRNAAPGQASKRRGNPQTPAARAAGDPGQLASHADSHPRRQPLLLPRGHRLLPGERPRLHPRRCADFDPAPSCRNARDERQSVFRGRAKEGQGAPVQGVLRRRRKLEPRRAHHCAHRAGEEGTDARFVVTNLEGGRPKAIYEKIYCRRGCAENHIKSWKTHLAADRTSCRKATANQFPLFLHAGAYWLMWGLRAAMPKRSAWRVAQFDTLRLRLVKIAARMVEMRTQVQLHLPSACPYQAILRTVLGRLPRLIA